MYHNPKFKNAHKLLSNGKNVHMSKNGYAGTNINKSRKSIVQAWSIEITKEFQYTKLYDAAKYPNVNKKNSWFFMQREREREESEESELRMLERKMQGRNSSALDALNELVV